MVIPVVAWLMLGVNSQAQGSDAHRWPIPTFRQEIADAKVIISGHLVRWPRDGANGGPRTDLHIRQVLKADLALNKLKTIEIFPYFDCFDIPDRKECRFVILGEIFEGKLVPFRGVEVKSEAMMDYLKGIMALDPREPARALRFFFRYLEHEDPVIAEDTFREFTREFVRTEERQVAAMAKDLPADRIARCLERPDATHFHVQLYATLLGYCGNEGHAELFHRMLDEQRKTERDKGFDRLLVGYVLLKPREGWSYLCETLKDSSLPFMLRYHALRTIRFFWDQKLDTIEKKKLVEAASLLLDQGDIADLAIEDLRRWERWEVAERVLALYGKKSHDIPIVRRSILRYAICCPAAPAKNFIESVRLEDPETVKDVEEVVSFERDQAKRK